VLDSRMYVPTMIDPKGQQNGMDAVDATHEAKRIRDQLSAIAMSASRP